ncbi:hypothetical protein GGQ73_003473 [Rhizobium skierniewicense]|uniref:Uncharacterized protein n=1 Tax=Rhizobium skierniewicense TaxID=984260 RepID=A0A7W6CI36_9HYPH|nr:hypothetical protein [Rhizobium skierniewicense]UVY99392.1 hypothetical protein K4M20_00119 [Agrobacterium fabrum]UVY99799.1 hypothetical protein K4M19_00109 [Agrobacterium fabrum]CAD0217243.1 hypothetical protein AGTUEHA105_LOCUS5172 [Agrobacterium tumefaciens]
MSNILLITAAIIIPTATCLNAVPPIIKAEDTMPFQSHTPTQPQKHSYIGMWVRPQVSSPSSG